MLKFKNMRIIWLGQACFQIIVNLNKKEKAIIVIDPFSSEIGLKFPRIKADILLVTHNHADHSNIKGVSGLHPPATPFIISGPGEYEIKDIFIKGVSAFHDNSEGKERGKTTIYKIEAEDLKICHLGDLGQKELTDLQIEKLGTIDVLMIPVGGIYTISAKEAAKIISQIEPKIVIPMHYKIPKLKVKLESLDDFLKIMGQKLEKGEILNTLSLKERDLPKEGMRVVVMKP